MRARFGPFLFDSQTRELIHEAERIHLTAKAMRLLELLLSRRPEVVSRQQLYDHLWPDVAVSEANLKNLVAEIRRALGEAGRGGRFIRTVHHYGYAFVHPVVEEATPAAAVSLVGEDRRVLLWPGNNLVGRDDHCAVVIDDARISRQHARIMVGTDRVTIEDLGSKNGTFLRGSRLEQAEVVRDGDEIRFGPFRFKVRFASGSSLTESFVLGAAD